MTVPSQFMVWLRRTVAALCAALVCSLFQSSDAMATKHAFVVGTDRYANLGSGAQLQRAVNDAKSIAKVLERLGFNVSIVQNASRTDFNKGWQAFLEKLQEGDTAAFFFAGHGVEVEGQNFFLPADVPAIQTGRQELLKRESLSLSELLQDLRGRKPAVSILILDACRDNPFATPGQRGVGAMRGLAGVTSPPEGTFIMYSAAAGETALDRLPESDTNPNSVYTRALLEVIVQPGVGLPEMARSTRERVSAMALRVGHLQRPAYYDGVTGEFCLAGCKKVPAPKRGTADPTIGVAVADPVRLEIEIPRSVQRRVDFARGGPEAMRLLALQRVRGASYRLNPVSIEELAKLDTDLFVTEGMTAVSAATGAPLKPAELARLSTKPDKKRRIVISEFSLGEADNRRSDYFTAEYDASDKPDWLITQKSGEPGRYDVAFCKSGWQQTLLGDEQGSSVYNSAEPSPLLRLVELGFHGVLLTNIDVYRRLPRQCPEGVKSMAQFITRVVAVARRRNPEFIVLVEHDEAVVSIPEVDRVIDGVVRRVEKTR